MFDSTFLRQENGAKREKTGEFVSISFFDFFRKFEKILKKSSQNSITI